MSSYLHKFFLIIFTLFATTIFAKNEFKITVPYSDIFEGDIFNIQVVISLDATQQQVQNKEIDFSEWEKIFKIIQCQQSQSTSSNVMIIGNERKQKFTVRKIYSLLLTAKTKGEYTLPQLKTIINNRELISNGAIINIKELPENKKGKLEIVLDREKYYIGEVIPATIISTMPLETTENRTDHIKVEDSKQLTIVPDYSKLKPNRRLRTAFIFNNEYDMNFPYEIKDIKQNSEDTKRQIKSSILIYPNEIGKIPLPEITYELTLTRNMAMHRNGTWTRRTVSINNNEENQKYIYISETPSLNRPAQFYNLVSSSDKQALQTRINTNNIKFGEPIILTITLENDFSINQLRSIDWRNNPELKNQFLLPEDKPIITRVNANAVEWEFMVRPRNAEMRFFPQLHLHFFSVKDNDYQKLSSGTIPIKIEPTKIIPIENSENNNKIEKFEFDFSTKNLQKQDYNINELCYYYWYLLIFALLGIAIPFHKLIIKKITKTDEPNIPQNPPPNAKETYKELYAKIDSYNIQTIKEELNLILQDENYNTTNKNELKDIIQQIDFSIYSGSKNIDETAIKEQLKKIINEEINSK